MILVFLYLCEYLPWEEFVPFEHSAIASKPCRSPLHGHHQAPPYCFNLIVMYEYTHEQASLRSPVG